MKTSRLCATGAAFAVVLASSQGFAQTSLEGFALNSYDPSDPGADWFALESLDLHRPLVPSFGVTGDYAHNPLVFHQDDEEVAIPIETQFFVHLGAGLTLTEQFRVGLALPLALVHDGSSGDYRSLNYETESGSSVGDLRFSAHWLAFGKHDGPVRAGLGLQVFFPTGRQETYVSDGKMRVEPRVQLAGDISSFAYAARVGVQYRARNEDYLGYPFGTQLTFGLAGGVRLVDNKLLLGPELYGTTMVSDGGDGFFRASGDAGGSVDWWTLFAIGGVACSAGWWARVDTWMGVA